MPWPEQAMPKRTDLTGDHKYDTLRVRYVQCVKCEIWGETRVSRSR